MKEKTKAAKKTVAGTQQQLSQGPGDVGWWLVTTAHRGVFFGRGPRQEGKVVVLKDAQMCVFWSANMRGVLGLASSGPDRNCKITKPVPEIILQEVTSFVEVTPEAALKWKEAPWA